MNYLYLTTFALLFVACTNKKIEQLELENQELKQAIIILRKQQRIMENSVVIPYDSIPNYMMPVSFGSPSLKVAENASYTVLMAWAKFPVEVRSIFKLTKGQGKITETEKDKTMQKIYYSYSKPGKMEEEGAYSITLPNGRNRELGWLKLTTVK